MRLIQGCAFVFAAVLLSGCGGGATVSGKVTYKGDKVTGGNVTFSPVAKDGAKAGTPVTATLNADGTYSVTGATAGKNKVSFAVATSADPVVLKPGESAKPAPFSGLMVKDQDVEVKGGTSTVDIELIEAPKN